MADEWRADIGTARQLRQVDKQSTLNKSNMAHINYSCSRRIKAYAVLTVQVHSLSCEPGVLVDGSFGFGE